MNSKERILAALRLEIPDRVPVFEWFIDVALTKKMLGTDDPVEVTEQLGDGQEHVFAVKVRNRGGAGGIYEPVYLMAADEPLDKAQLWRMAKKQNQDWPWLWE